MGPCNSWRVGEFNVVSGTSLWLPPLCVETLGACVTPEGCMEEVYCDFNWYSRTWLVQIRPKIHALDIIFLLVKYKLLCILLLPVSFLIPPTRGLCQKALPN